jgi:hypothetical protein
LKSDPSVVQPAASRYTGYAIPASQVPSLYVTVYESIYKLFIKAVSTAVVIQSRMLYIMIMLEEIRIWDMVVAYLYIFLPFSND